MEYSRMHFGLHQYTGDMDDWELVEDGDFKGIALATDRKNGEIVYMSTKHCGAVDLWNKMPSLEEFPSLIVLDLHKCRYIVDLHESVGSLVNLQQLLLTRCSKLRTLPSTLGNLENLVEVRRET